MGWSDFMPMPRPIGTVKFLLAWLTPWQPTFAVRAIPSNLIFYVHHRDAIGRHIAKYGTHEPLLTRWLMEYLKDARAGLFVDVGANVGWHALHAARQSTIEVAVAFEPDLFNAALLERNVTANQIKNVIISKRAVGAKPGTLLLFSYKSCNFGRHSAVVDCGYGSRTVPMINLDSGLAEMQLGDRVIAALKIDVEGFEPAVIEGAPETLERTDVVLLEYSPELSRRLGERVIDDMLRRLQDASFSPFVLRNSGGVVQVAIDELHHLGGSIDLIWAKKNAIGRLKERSRGAVSLNEITEQNKRVKLP